MEVSILLVSSVTFSLAITFRNGDQNTQNTGFLRDARPSASDIDNIYITSTSSPYHPLGITLGLFEPSPDHSQVYITSTTANPLHFTNPFGTEHVGLFKQEAGPAVVGAPPEVLQRYSTKVVPVDLPVDLPGGPGGEQVETIQGDPSRYRPVHYKASPSLAPVTDFFGESSLGLSSNVDDNGRKIQQITSPKKQYKKNYHKNSYKKPKFPKKYKTSNLKKLNKIKLLPIQKLDGFDGPDSLKPKRKIPLSFYKEAPASNPFSEELVSFHKSSGLDAASFSAPSGGHGERVEFQMYGMDGPHSYKFGYDTGKGHNRHYRFEERDNQGKVKGQYGFYDKDGNMRIMKYEADPHTGFHAGPYDHPENDFF